MKKISAGDIVYIYVNSPDSHIAFKGRIVLYFLVDEVKKITEYVQAVYEKMNNRTIVEE